MILNGKIRFDGDTPCLNLVNTIHDRTEAVTTDYLNTPADVTLWARKAGIAKLNARLDGKSLKKVKTLRQLLYTIFLAVSQGANIPQAALREFDRNWRSVQSHLQLKRSHDRYIERWHFDEGDLNWILAPVIKDARDLLLSDMLSRVRSCPSCGWLFLDKTKNGTRRWCSMETCGGNVKALQWYYRQKN